MNKWQRASAGLYGAIENTLDDLRHTWERVFYERKVTGDVNMFPSVYQQQQEPSAVELFDKYYGQTQELPEHGQELGQEPEIER